MRCGALTNLSSSFRARSDDEFNGDHEGGEMGTQKNRRKIGVVVVRWSTIEKNRQNGSETAACSSAGTGLVGGRRKRVESSFPVKHNNLFPWKQEWVFAVVASYCLVLREPVFIP